MWPKFTVFCYYCLVLQITLFDIHCAFFSSLLAIQEAEENVSQDAVANQHRKQDDNVNEDVDIFNTI
tara:strand:- start:347 stop:547 length:201 start_codon:yes stop_codon:yes gene_type:complete